MRSPEEGSPRSNLNIVDRQSGQMFDTVPLQLFTLLIGVTTYGGFCSSP